MAGTPLTQLQTFLDVVNQLDSSIRAQLSLTNNSARAELSLVYTFNNDGTITIKISTVSKTINTATQVLGVVTV
jgi:hypothetical protein